MSSRDSVLLQHVPRRTRLDDNAAIEDDDSIREPARFVSIVGHIENRYCQLVAHALEIRQDPAAELEVNGRQRLIEQENVWR